MSDLKNLLHEASSIRLNCGEQSKSKSQTPLLPSQTREDDRIPAPLIASNECTARSFILTASLPGTPDRPVLAAAILLILLIDERVGHPGDVVADDAGQRLCGGFFAVVARQIVGLLHPVGEELSGDALGVFFLCRQRRAVVKIFVQKVFQPAALLFD